MKGKTPPLSVRRAPVASRSPSSVDREQRTVEFVAATERAVKMWDWEHGEIDEVLLMKGAVLPQSRQIPLLDTHSRHGVEDVLGSARELRVEDGQLIATAHFSSVPRADEVLTKIAEGHLTDCSVGYRISDYTTVKKGEKAVIGGRTWQGPVRVVTSWLPRELSVCPIGADEAAKARAAGGDPVNVELNAPAHTSTEDDMNPALRKLLEARGLATTATEEEAWDFYVRMNTAPAGPAPSTPAPAATDPADVDELRKAELRKKESILKAERKRIDEIKLAAQAFREMGYIGLDELEDRCIQDGATVETAHKALAEHCKRQSRPDAGLPSSAAIIVTKDERDKFREFAVAGLCVRTGREKLVDEKLRTGHDLARLTLKELMQHTNRMAGLPADTLISSRSIGGSDLPHILGDYQNKIVQEGYAGANVTYRTWCKTAVVSNLQTIHLPVISAVSKAPHISTKDGQYRYLNLSDAEETCALLKSGGILRISDQVILNDDTLSIQQAAEGVGDVCARAVNIDVYGDTTAEDYGVIIGSGGVGETMRDTTAIFTSGHANYVAIGSGAAPSVATLSAGQAAMRKQKDISGTYPLNWTPSFLIVPAALEGTAEQLLTSTYDPAKSNDARNPFFGRLQLVVEPLLDLGPTGAATRWYLAGPQGKSVWVFFHESTNDRPVVEQQAGWYVDGMEWKCHIYHKAKAADWRGLYCNYGA